MRRAILILIIQAFAASRSYAGYGDVVSEFRTSVPGPSGLTWDGNDLWTCGNDGLIYKVAGDGAILHSIPMPDTGHIEAYHPDIAWDGAHLWFANYADYNSERAVFQLSPEDGTILREFRNIWIERAGDDGFGLEYSRSTDTFILTQGSGYNRLIVLDALDGSFVETTPLPGRPRGGLALTKDSTPQEIWVGGERPEEQRAVAKLSASSGYIHSLFVLDAPISGLAWNGSNMVSVDADGLVRMYDVANPCNPGIITLEPGVDEFCQNQNPTFSWTAECTDTFIVDFARHRDFREPVTSFPVGATTRVVMPDSVRDEFPMTVPVFWRVRGFVDGGFAKKSDVRFIRKYFSAWCPEDPGP